jgi:hypothetical protein
MTSFLRKNRLFSKRVVPTLNLTFFKSEKSKSVVQRPKIYQKKLPEKIFQDGGYFQNGVILVLSNSFLGCVNIF